ncbi:MAG: hypothetical protein JNL43_10920 [Flavobacteriales bacterium]|nr:hypothetical protein [Flavobacteriales bacterium]
MEHARRPTRINTLNVLFLIAVFGLISLIAACGTNARPPRLPLSTALLVRSIILAPKDSMHVYDSTYQRLRALFDANFNLGTGRPIQQREQEIAWEALADLIPAGTGRRYALCFDYGLDGDSMRYGISVLELKPTDDAGRYTYTVPDSLFVLEKGKLVAHLASRWQRDAQYDPTNPAAYFSRVQVRHKPGSGFDPVDHDADPHAEVMAWNDELLRLHAQNATGHADSTFFAVFRCISKEDDDGLLRHRVCIHLRLRPKNATSGPYNDLLDNARDGTRLLRGHGADYGNLNPPGSDWYDLPPE